MNQEQKQVSKEDKIQKAVWERKWQEVIFGGMIVFSVFSVFAVFTYVAEPSPKIEDYSPYKEAISRETMTDAEKTGRIIFSGGCAVVALLGAGVIAFGALKFYRFPGAEKLAEIKAKKEQARAEREQARKERAEKANQARLEKEKAKAAKKLEKEMAKAGSRKPEPEKPKTEAEPKLEAVPVVEKAGEVKEEKKPKSWRNLFGGKKKVEAVATAVPETKTKAEEQKPVATEEVVQETTEKAAPPQPALPKPAAPSNSFFDEEVENALKDKADSQKPPQKPQPEKPDDDEPLKLQPLDEEEKKD